MGRQKYKTNIVDSRDKMLNLMNACSWNISRAMRVLNLTSRNHFYILLKTYEIPIRKTLMDERAKKFIEDQHLKAIL